MRRFLPLALCACIVLSQASAAQAMPTLTVTVLPEAAQGSVPQGAQRIVVLTIEVTASCDASVPVVVLTARHSGLGSVQDFLRAYVLDGNVRVSATSTVTADAPFSLRLRNITVPACTSKKLSLAVDLASSALSGGEHHFDLVSVEARNAAVSSSSSSSSASKLRVTPRSSQPSVELEFRPVLTDTSYGANRVVARFLVTAKGRNQEIVSIMLSNDGSAAGSDLQNLYVETSSRDALSEPMLTMKGRTAPIEFSPPLFLRRNQSVLLQLRADVRASRTRTIQWTLDDPSDVVARDAARR